MNLRSVIDELEKLGAVSTNQARRALDRLDVLEQQKPTPGQVLRYGAVGGAAGAGIGAVGNLIAGNRQGGLRGVASNAVKGALGAGALPLIQAGLDRRAQMGTLKKYVQQPEPKTAGLLDTVKNLALKGVGGPKGLLQPAGQAVANVGKKVAPAAQATRRTAGGAYDVSSMARAMGV